MRKYFEEQQWQGRIDENDGEAGLRWHQKVNAFDGKTSLSTGKNVVIAGFACDEGVRRNQGRPGAAAAPTEIRKFLASKPWRDPNLSLYDAGDVLCIGEDLEGARDLQQQLIADITKHNALPIFLGGGHEIAYGSFLGLSKNESSIGIINIDAHFDLRSKEGITSSGTPFFDISEHCKSINMPFEYICIGIQEYGNTQALFETAEALQVKYTTAEEVLHSLQSSIELIDSLLNKTDAIYLTLDMDVLDAAFAPGVSAPASMGLLPNQVNLLLRYIAQSGKLRLMDVAEVNPKFDIDSRSSRLAAHFIAGVVDSWQY
ncbi:MAG: formimidoylglutamase [Weeksellaceae bacterium]|nr:formimidoylglutamase [Weeksellaceae bacterium]